MDSEEIMVELGPPEFQPILGITEGVNPFVLRRQSRTIRFSEDDPLAQHLIRYFKN